jgi:cytochrome c2
MLRPLIVVLGFVVVAGIAGAQEVAPRANDMTGDPEKGRALFGEHCQLCHKAGPLAASLYLKPAEQPRRDVCAFLQTHGRTDAERDCDIVAYLKALARQPAQ